MGLFAKACAVTGGLALMGGAPHVALLMGVTAFLTRTRGRADGDSGETEILKEAVATEDDAVAALWRETRPKHERHMSIERVIEVVDAGGHRRDRVVSRREFHA